MHGSVGLGKTHLMQAIGHLIQANKKHLKVFYVTSEQFTNDYISAIQHGELAKFRKSYRQVDVLLIDDVVEDIEEGGVTRRRHQVPAVGLGTHEQELVGIGADEVEGLGGKAQRTDEIGRRRTARPGDEDPLQRRAPGLVWSIGAIVACPRLSSRSTS